MPILISITAGVFVYSLIISVISLATRRKAAVDERLIGLKDSRADTVPKPVRKKKKRKNSGEAAARTKKQLEKLENQIYDVGIKIPVQQFLLIWSGVTFFLPLLLMFTGLPGVISVAVALACALGPVLYINIRKNKRRNELEGQLIEAISILCNALRAGHSFQGAMNNISQEMTGAVAEEFGRVFRETQHGMTLEESLGRMVERTGSGDLEMLCTAIIIQREVGGNLAEVLENISGTIQARLTLKAEIKTRTASGRLSGYIIGALPVILLIAMNTINPSYCSMLFETHAGHVMLGIGAGMEVIGLIVIMKMVSVKY